MKRNKKQLIKSVKRSFTGYIMISPAFLLYSVFVLIPIISTFMLSFNEWMGIGVKKFIGFDNYLSAFSDELLLKSFLNNVLWTIGVIIFGVFTGLILATLLFTQIPGRLVFQTIFFIPRLLTMVVVGVVWGWIYNPNFGILNKFLIMIGLEKFAIGWLGRPGFALWAIIIAGSWTYFGFCMVIFMAALQNTDKTLNECALIDGANRLQIFFYIILPQIRNTITLVIMISIIDSFKVFDLVYVMTRGGPGDSTQIIATHLYREAFRHSKFGYASTLAIILTLFVLLVSIFFLRIREKNV